MELTANRSRIAIAGGGLGGTLMAIYLGRRGLDVQVFERRADLRTGVVDGGRSISMTIAERGLRALEPVGLRDAVTAITLPLKGRLVHGADGRAEFQRYGRTPAQVHRAFNRTELNALLLDAAAALPTVRLSFHSRYVRGFKESGRVVIEDVRTSENRYVPARLLIGADGAYSSVRAEMHRGELADYEQHYLREGYKELTIPPARGGAFRLDPEVVHVWPRGTSVLIAIPNRDGSFTCTVTMPFTGPESFASLRSRDETQRFFERHFAQALALVPEMVDEFTQRTPARYLTTMSAPWHYEDRIVLLGDACHSVLPFYAQGMNAAFEDCQTLDRCLASHGDDWEAAFVDYESRRKRHTDALARLSQQNYVELKERIRSPMFLARRRIDLALDRWWPRAFSTLYSMISHTAIPYADAVAICERRERWLRWTGLQALLTLASAPLAIATMIRTSTWATRSGARRPAATRGRVNAVAQPESADADIVV
jgi:kynurenine 3-monooxygenase